MKWTKQKPSQRGWYWYKYDENPNYFPVEIIFWEDEFQIGYPDGGMEPVSQIKNCKFAGPIEEPTDE